MKIKIPKKLKKSTGCGISCYFYPLNKKMGLKLFRSKVRAEQCQVAHSIVASHPKTKALVPKVYSKLIQIGQRWGYVVEKVKVHGCGDVDVDNILEETKFSTYQRLMNPLRRVLIDNMPKHSSFHRLFNNKDQCLNLINTLFMDDHFGNIGIREQKIIWIDFSYRI